MSSKPAPRCPGCGKEMELMELERNTWRYSCEDCGWRSPAVHGPGKEGKDRAYDKAMQRYTENPWISVKDRMPDKVGSYLVCVGTSVFTANYMPAHCAYSQCVEAGFCSDLFGFTKLLNVTHWMPLPKPPKEENKTDG